MFGRPRCREWTPLSSQQLRLRSLIQIVGYNIRPPEGCTAQCSFYLTLHHTTMSAPFYTSERINCPHPKWKEIDSDITQRMSSTNMVIRIWCHVIQSHNQDGGDQKQDTIIETWGVYFSGLRYIGANLSLNFTSDCFKSNTLVFQMNGGYFCSYRSLKLDIIPPENELENGSLSSESSGKKSEPKLIPNRKLLKESRSISPSKFAKKFEREYSKSHSPSERGFQQNIPTMKTSVSLNINKSKDNGKKNDPNHIYEHSPNSLDVKEFSDENCDSMSMSKEDLSSKIDVSETAESYDLRNESEVPKYRYLALSFLKSEIRPSYNASKLQKLHLLQYSIKKKQEAVQEVKERINKISAVTNNWSFEAEKSTEKIRLKRSQKSLFCLDETELVSSKKLDGDRNGKVKEDRPMHVGSRYSLKLNDLLSYKSKPSPFQRAEYLRLTKQLEVLRFKRIILSDERDAKLANIRRLKEIHAKMFEENQDVGSELMQQYHSLSRSGAARGGGRDAWRRALRDRAHCAAQLLHDILLIFPIHQIDQTTWTICDVPLPICGDDLPRASNPVSDSVASGFVAQALCVAAAILDMPLRYRIVLLGSASKIVDVNDDLPDPNIPLFVRGGDVTLFRYALFLLNKCIAQVSFARGVSVADMRPTLHNLHKILSQPHSMAEVSKLYATQQWVADTACSRTQSLRSLAVTERTKYRQFNRFKDAIDGQSPETAMYLRRHRHSRSVGSYNDDQELSILNTSTTSIMGSEPNVYTANLDQLHSKLNSKDFTQNSLTNNSDSEINKTTEPEMPVTFVLGDETVLKNLETHLVKISTNNGDGSTSLLNENVKKICSEIEDFCLQPESDGSNCCPIDAADHTIDNLDIAKYMERKLVSQVSCDTCEKTEDVCDIACANNLSEVILLPNVEGLDNNVLSELESDQVDN